MAAAIDDDDDDGDDALKMRNLSGSNLNQWMIDGLRSAGEHVNKFSNTMDLRRHVTYFYRKLYI